MSAGLVGTNFFFQLTIIFLSFLEAVKGSVILNSHLMPIHLPTIDKHPHRLVFPFSAQDIPETQFLQYGIPHFQKMYIHSIGAFVKMVSLLVPVNKRPMGLDALLI